MNIPPELSDAPEYDYSNDDYRGNTDCFSDWAKQFASCIAPKPSKTIDLGDINGNVESRKYMGWKSNSIASVGDISGGVGRMAFQGCTNLTSVGDIGGDVGTNAFYDCEKLETVGDISGSVEYNAFHNCTSLTTVGEISGGVRGDVFKGCDKLKTVNGMPLAEFLSSRMRR